MRTIDDLIEREGGLVNDANDRGGVTKYGISSRSYPALDVAAITKEDARDIYFEDFWRPCCCDQIASQLVANLLFDFAVNTGVKRSIKTLQKCLSVAVNGFIGPITIAAINDADCELIALRFTVLRIDYYSRLAAKKKSQRKFLHGWINRAIDALND